MTIDPIELGAEDAWRRLNDGAFIMSTSKFLTRVEINEKLVSFFSPPHAGPDFAWVDIEELAAAFLPDEDAKRMVIHAQNFNGENRTAVTVRNGDRIATIVPHPIAQGMCGMIDLKNGFVGENEDDAGPVHWAYCIKAGQVADDHLFTSLDDMFVAFRRQGGPFLKGLREQ